MHPYLPNVPLGINQDIPYLVHRFQIHVKSRHSIHPHLVSTSAPQALHKFIISPVHRNPKLDNLNPHPFDLNPILNSSKAYK